MYSVADLFDFGFGSDDLRGRSQEADEHFQNARSSMESAARLLATGASNEAAVQSACLTAELGLKGVLTLLGVGKNERKALSHHIHSLASRLAELKPASSDLRLRSVSCAFPDYIGTRYKWHGLSRTELNELAMRAQYVAAEAIRRVSSRNMAAEVEGDPQNAARDFP